MRRLDLSLDDLDLDDCDDRDERFDAVSEELLARLRDRLPLARPDAPVDEVLHHVETILDYKHRYSDDRLGSWSVAEVSEYLLEWCPRKLSGRGDEWATMPAALDLLVETLALEDLLATPGSTLAAVRREIERCDRRFVAAMDDPSRWGMAKSIVGSVTDGFADDDLDPAELMAAFNSLPEEERRRVLEGVRPTGPRAPAVMMPSASRVAESAAAAPVLAQLRAVADFYGGGRPVTQSGNPRLADAAELVARLGTGDEIDEVIGDRTFKTRSAAELPELRLAITLARKAGVVRLAKGKLSATKVGRTFGDDPVASLRRVWDAVVALGPLGALRGPRGSFLPSVEEFLDGELAGLLSIPYSEEPVPVEAVVEQAADVVQGAFVFRHPLHDEAFVTNQVANLVRRTLALTELLGVTRLVAAESIEQPEVAAFLAEEGITAILGLTPVGRVLVRDLLLDAGWQAPILEAELTDLPVDELFEVLADIDDSARSQGEMEAWAAARTPEQALDEVRAVVGVRGFPGLWAAALQMLGPSGLDGGAIRAELEEWARHELPTVRAVARWALVADFDAEPSSLHEPGDEVAWLFALGLAVAAGSYEVGTVSALDEDPAALAALFDALWRDPDPFTEVALELLGEGHPHEPTAKAARRALLRRRSAAVGG